MNSPRTRFYRDKVNGKIFGVCAGIADYTGVNVLWVRVGMALLALSGIPFVIPAYFLTAIFAPTKPAALYGDQTEQRFWQGVRQSPRRTSQELRGKLREIDRRLADIETYYVSSNPRLSAEIERLR